ncbi:MAG: STAS/SEC14 domain-containing protein [Candidatus Competibacteraceae bacterium]|nr:STAS/SEC14 domain-containing protein [Candidatus Competibacteraceae bacterium]
MLAIGDLNENKVLTITVEGKLTKEDYTHTLPQMEALLQQHGTIRFYIKLENFQGFELGAVWEDLKFDYKNQSQFGKTAVVGDKKWEEWGTNFSNLFFDAEMRFFSKEQAEEAWNWVNS